MTKLFNHHHLFWNEPSMELAVGMASVHQFTKYKLQKRQRVLDPQQRWNQENICMSYFQLIAIHFKIGKVCSSFILQLWSSKRAQLRELQAGAAMTRKRSWWLFINDYTLNLVSISLLTSRKMRRAIKTVSPVFIYSSTPSCFHHKPS